MLATYKFHGYVINVKFTQDVHSGLSHLLKHQDITGTDHNRYTLKYLTQPRERWKVSIRMGIQKEV